MLIAISVFFIALVFSMFGMGGGLFFMPLFLLFFDSFKEASTLSFLCILVTSFSAMITYHQKKLIDWKLLGYLGIPGVNPIDCTECDRVLDRINTPRG